MAGSTNIEWTEVTWNPVTGCDRVSSDNCYDAPFGRVSIRQASGRDLECEYLATIGFLGPEVLAGHCVQVDANDIRLLAGSGVKVANNAVSNLFLGAGIAPVSEMLTAGLTVGIGTEDGNCNNATNILSDMKFVAKSPAKWGPDSRSSTRGPPFRILP